MPQLTNLWKTKTGKLAILGGGIIGLLSLCFVCAICGTLFGGDDSSEPVAERSVVSFATEAPIPESTATLEPTSTPEPTATAIPLVDTATPTPEPTSTPEPEAPKPIVSAGEGNINMRSGPGTDYEVVGTLPAGQSLEIVGRNADSSWWQVNAPDGLCWIATSVTTASNADDSIPVVEAPQASVQEQPTLHEAQVVEVVDGDTIKVLIDGAEYTVRYILVDTPETKHPEKPVEPFGPEASAANQELVGGKTVRLEKDVSETDQYGRLLRYVYVGDLMVNEELLRRGLAQVVTYPPDVKYVDRFLAMQQEAQANGAGMWGQPVAEATTEAPPAATGGNVVITNIFYDGLVKQVESDEYIEVANQGGEPVDMTGWHINAGDPGQDFYFPQGFVMQPGQSCRVYTNEIHPETCGFSFGRGQAIWNNKGDVGFLYNGQGELVSQRGY